MLAGPGGCGAQARRYPAPAAGSSWAGKGPVAPPPVTGASGSRQREPQHKRSAVRPGEGGSSGPGRPRCEHTRAGAAQRVGAAILACNAWPRQGNCAGRPRGRLAARPWRQSEPTAGKRRELALPAPPVPPHRGRGPFRARGRRCEQPDKQLRRTWPRGSAPWGVLWAEHTAQSKPTDSRCCEHGCGAPRSLRGGPGGWLTRVPRPGMLPRDLSNRGQSTRAH